MPRFAKKRKYSGKDERDTVYGRSIAKVPQVLRYHAPVAPRHRCTLKYFDSQQLSGTGTDEQWFRANSVFDPDYTNVGHQPGGYDELTQLYLKYRVDRCTIRATVVANGANSRPINLTAIIKDNPTALGVTWNAMEQPGATPFVTQGYTGNTEYLSYSFDLAKVSGQTKSEWMSKDDNSSAVTTNPADVVWLVLHGSYADGTSSGFDAYVSYMLTFDVTFFDPVLTSSS